MQTTTQVKPIIRPYSRPASETIGIPIIESFNDPKAETDDIMNFPTDNGKETNYSSITLDEPLSMLRKHFSGVQGIKRICISYENYVIHVWIIIDKEDWEIRERVYKKQYDVYILESSAFRFNFHVSEERELTDCMPLMGG